MTSSSTQDCIKDIDTLMTSPSLLDIDVDKCRAIEKSISHCVKQRERLEIDFSLY